MFIPVASCPVDCDQGGKDADQEQDQHHVLSKADVLLLDPGTVAVTKYLIHSIKVSAP